MTVTTLRLMVFGQDGKEHDIEIEKGGSATLGNIPGCTVDVGGMVPFMFTLIAWDQVRGRHIMQLTDAIKGELYVEGVTRRLGDFKRDGSAQGVESLGIWALVLPVPCSGYLEAAGAVLHFELADAEKERSETQDAMQPANENVTPIEIIFIRRRS